MIAPCMPLLSDAIYQNLKEQKAPQSIHFCDWIKGESPSELESALLEEMSLAQNIINQGRSLRQELKLKIRQPLQKIIISQEQKIKYFNELICSELNVKEVEQSAGQSENSVQLDTQLTPELLAEGLAREFIHSIQNLRKASGFEVDDRIELFINFPASTSEFPGLLRTQKSYILSEVLALSWKEEIQETAQATFSRKNIKLNGFELEVGILKASK
jgi:isoleucyl-tRNA synthetase